MVQKLTSLDKWDNAAKWKGPQDMWLKRDPAISRTVKQFPWNFQEDCNIGVPRQAKANCGGAWINSWKRIASVFYSYKLPSYRGPFICHIILHTSPTSLISAMVLKPALAQETRLLNWSIIEGAKYFQYKDVRSLLIYIKCTDYFHFLNLPSNLWSSKSRMVLIVLAYFSWFSRLSTSLMRSSSGLLSLFSNSTLKRVMQALITNQE